jgi:hypothetical protein
MYLIGDDISNIVLFNGSHGKSWEVMAHTGIFATFFIMTS